MFVVLLDVNGKQPFIFSSPRLRENIGASYQITLLENWATPVIEEVTGDVPRWVSRTSGKVIFLVDEEDSAQTVIRKVTATAFTEAPGIDVSGVYVEVTESHLQARDLRRLDREALLYALSRPPAVARFQQMPFLARAQDSTLPAAPPLGKVDEDKEDQKELYSLPSRVKRYDALMFRNHLLDLARKSRRLYDEDDKFARDLTKLENMLQDRPAQEPRNNATVQASDDDNFVALPKVAVIHIDGNGVGAVMRDLESAKALISEDDFVSVTGCKADDADSLRHFILAVNGRLDRAVENAFVAAWESVATWAKWDARQEGRPYTAIPVVPVLLGGDDVTVITSGDYALPFAVTYLKRYEENTRADPILSVLGSAQSGVSGPMTAAAGVAIVRRNFPFHIAYDLAECLVRRAKKVGKPSQQSTIDYHVLFDSTVLDSKELLRSYTAFTTRPFRLPPEEDVIGLDGTPATGNLEIHEPWKTTCMRVAKFTGLIPPSPKVKPRAFPKVRATRIRKLLSDSVKAKLSSDGGRGEAGQCAATDCMRARNEWKDAADKLGWSDVDLDINDVLGGPKAVFDLLELADLLPPSYLAEFLGLQHDGPEHTSNSSPEEVQA